MGIQAPFVYNSSPYSRESRGPFCQFNSKPTYQASSSSMVISGITSATVDPSDSYFFLPKSKINAYHMSRSVKKFINLTRKCLFVISLGELLSACALFITGIIANPIENSTAWIIRLSPVFAMIHSAYAIYYLGCKKTARAIAFSAYCYFFACLDAITIPLYMSMLLFYAARPIESRSMVSDNPNLNFILCYQIGMYCAGASGGLYLISIFASLYMGRVYHKIAAMPPDMNPLEDNLTSRHKRNKSSIVTTSTKADDRESRVFRSKRGSINDSIFVNSQSIVPFIEVKPEISGSTHDYPPISRDPHQYQLNEKFQFPPHQSNLLELKKSSCCTPSLNIPSNMDVIPGDNHILHDEFHRETISNTWYGKDSLSKRHKYARSLSPQKYSEKYNFPGHEKESTVDYVNLKQENQPSSSFPTDTSNRLSLSSNVTEGDLSSKYSMDSVDIGDFSLNTTIKQTALRPRRDSQHYGDLGLGKPPITAGRNGIRQSSGHDYVFGEWNSYGKIGLRDIRGRIPVENRGEGRLSGMRVRKFSGKLLF